MGKMAKGICAQCGNVYEETKYSFLCLDCRKARLRANAKRINLSQLGHQARKKARK